MPFEYTFHPHYSWGLHFPICLLTNMYLNSKINPYSAFVVVVNMRRQWKLLTRLTNSLPAEANKTRL